MARKLLVEPIEINPEKAAQIRRWRVDDEMTWRSVAQAASDCWGSEYGSNQIYGMDLCRVAAETLGEDPDKDPWNQLASPEGLGPCLANRSETMLMRGARTVLRTGVIPATER